MRKRPSKALAILSIPRLLDVLLAQPEPRACALTARQQECFTLIMQGITENGFPPTFRELAKAMGVKSTNTIADFLLRLEREGYIENKGERKDRAIRVVGYRWIAVRC
jgi:repressor LexA